METDVTLYNPRTKKKIILDAKYYKETLVSRYGEGGKIRREHLSQILTYVMNQESDAPHTKCTKGILVYPTIDTELDVSYVYKDTKHVIRVSTVNLNQDWQMIDKRLKEIIKWESNDDEPRLVFELEYLESLPEYKPVNLTRYWYKDTLLGRIMK